MGWLSFVFELVLPQPFAGCESSRIERKPNEPWELSLFPFCLSLKDTREGTTSKGDLVPRVLCPVTGSERKGKIEKRKFLTVSGH